MEIKKNACAEYTHENAYVQHVYGDAYIKNVPAAIHLEDLPELPIGLATSNNNGKKHKMKTNIFKKLLRKLGE